MKRHPPILVDPLTRGRVYRISCGVSTITMGPCSEAVAIAHARDHARFCAVAPKGIVVDLIALSSEIAERVVYKIWRAKGEWYEWDLYLDKQLARKVAL